MFPSYLLLVLCFFTISLFKAVFFLFFVTLLIYSFCSCQLAECHFLTVLTWYLLFVQFNCFLVVCSSLPCLYYTCLFLYFCPILFIIYHPPTHFCRAGFTIMTPMGPCLGQQSKRAAPSLKIYNLWQFYFPLLSTSGYWWVNSVIVTLLDEQCELLAMSIGSSCYSAPQKTLHHRILLLRCFIQAAIYLLHFLWMYPPTGQQKSFRRQGTSHHLLFP